MSTPSRLDVRDLCMTFWNNRVLRDVSIDVQPGEIHGLIGQNGSGKSTLAKVLTGLYAPDDGTRVAIDGTDLRLPVRLSESRERGVAIVHQNLGLLDDETVLENMRMGRLRGSRFLRRIDWRAERARAAEVFGRLGRTVPLDVPVRALREEDRATVAIARALQDVPDGRGLIIFDESTRALGRRALEHFFGILDEIVATGTAVLMITHRLEEVVDAADRVSVLRDGRIVESGRDVAGLTEADVAGLMLGQALVNAEKTPSHAQDEAPAVRIEELSGLGVRDLSLQIRPGEIVGLTGIAGSGFDDVPYLLGGVSRAGSGTLRLQSGTLPVSDMDPATAIASGVSLIPEGRESAGLSMSMSMLENIAFTQTSRSRRPFSPLSRQVEHDLVDRWIDRLDIRPREPRMSVKNLSGGNQQKVLLAKWLATDPELFLLHEPTQAVDVGARETIVDAIRTAASRGCAVLVAGTDENELSLLCDRVLVFADGAVGTELTDDVGPTRIVETIYGSGTRARLRAQRTVPTPDTDESPRP